MSDSLVRPENWHQMFTEKLQQAIAKAGSKSALARAIGVHYTTVTDWLRGGCPAESRIRLVEEFLSKQSVESSKADIRDFRR